MTLLLKSDFVTGLPPLTRAEFDQLLIEHPEAVMMHGRKVLAGVDAVERGELFR